MNEITRLRNKAKRLNARSSDMRRQASDLYNKAAELEAKQVGFELGQAVEGYWHVGVKTPKWIKGTIVLFFAESDGKGCATLKDEKGKRRAFYFKSMRVPQ